jgi:hypothetical protein
LNLLCSGTDPLGPRLVERSVFPGCRCSVESGDHLYRDMLPLSSPRTVLLDVKSDSPGGRGSSRILEAVSVHSSENCTCSETSTPGARAGDLCSQADLPPPLGCVNHSPMKTHYPRYQEFLRRLRQARECAGPSQSEAERRLSKTQAFIWKCEVGERRVDIVGALLFAPLYSKSAQYFCTGLLDTEGGRSSIAGRGAFAGSRSMCCFRVGGF